MDDFNFLVPWKKNSEATLIYAGLSWQWIYIKKLIGGYSLLSGEMFLDPCGLASAVIL